MEVFVTNSDSRTVVRVVGRLDTVAAAQFEQALAPVWESERPDLFLDCREMEYISSSGLRVFLKLKKFVMGTEGSLELSDLKPGVREVFEMTGFVKMFQLR